MSAKLVVFDVNNAACNLCVCPNGYSMMIDCGSNAEKDCPVDRVLHLKDSFLKMKSYNGYDLTLLHVTHPDDDHVKNAKKVSEKLSPYLVHRRRHESFDVGENIHDEYKNHIDLRYRGASIKFDGWGFHENRVFLIPMHQVKSNSELNDKQKNNSSILRYVRYGNVRILFGGDLEQAGWDWLAANDKDFIRTMKNGLDILVAPHHGHKSGFPKSLFDLTGEVGAIVLSKASESEKQGTDIASQYSSYAGGLRYNTIDNKQEYLGKVFSTRSNGNLYFFFNEGAVTLLTDKYSSNHQAV